MRFSVATREDVQRLPLTISASCPGVVVDSVIAAWPRPMETFPSRRATLLNAAVSLVLSSYSLACSSSIYVRCSCWSRVLALHLSGPSSGYQGGSDVVIAGEWTMGILLGGHRGASGCGLADGVGPGGTPCSMRWVSRVWVCRCLGGVWAGVDLQL